MNIIVSIDDNGGMLFNNRRQSQDSNLRKRIIEQTSSHKLWMNQYSYSQFSDCPIETINVSNSFLSESENDDYCFIENIQASNYENKINKIIIYKWNRIYPADMHFDIKLDGWHLESTYEFKGSSHDKITEEVYTR